MSDVTRHIDSIESGLSSCRIGAKILIEILKKEIDSKDDKVKVAVETKKITALDYFHLLRIVKIQSDRLHNLLEENGMDDKLEMVQSLFDYLDGAYGDGIKAIRNTLDHLLSAIEVDYDRDLPADKLKSITKAKRVAADDYFFLLDFINQKEVERCSLHIVQKFVDDEEVITLDTGEDKNKRKGYAEQFAT